MDIKQKREDKKITVFPSGQINTNTSPDFLGYLKGVLDEAEELIIDLQDVSYISSAGLRVLLFAEKSLKGKGVMKVCHVNENIMEVFELTGFVDVLKII